MELGVDSASTPTASEAAAAANHGIKWWGGYIGGSAASNVWSPSGWSALRRAGITPVPIWVPDQSFSEDPVQQAHLAIRACQRAGLDGPIVLDTEHSATGSPHLKSFVDAWNRTLQQAGRTSVIYDGAGYHGNATEWLPSWGPDHTSGARSAKQYSGATPRWGVPGGVDLDVAGQRFPFGPPSRRSGHSGGGAGGGGGHRGRPGPQTGRVVVSPPELGSLATLLKDSEHCVISVQRQATSLLASLLEEANGAGGAGTAEVQQAVTILERVTGPGVDGLHHLSGSLWQGEAYVRRVHAQALHADQGGVSLTPAQAALLRTLARDGVDRRTLAKARAEMLAKDRRQAHAGHGTDNSPRGADGVRRGAGTAGIAAGWKVLRGTGGVPPELKRYGNGRVPLASLDRVASGQYLWKPAAVSYLRMRSAARASGVNLDLAASYRSYGKQVSLSHSEPGLAAAPGTSDHGWGRAIDVDGARADKWLDANASKFGWYHQVPGEPWHFTFGPEHIV